MSREDFLTDPATPRNVQPAGESGWGDPVFSEEFNGSVQVVTEAEDSFVRFRDGGPVWAAQYPDWPRFNAQVPGGNHTNTNQDAYFTLDQVNTSAGNLVLGTVKQATEGLPYKAGMIQSIPTFTPEQGYFEVRCRATATPSHLWPAAWLSNSNVNEWPPEIDFFEVIAGNVMQNVYGSHSTTTTPEPASFSGQWHTYGVEWTPDVVRFRIDGVVRSERGNPGVPDTPQYLILNSGAEAGATLQSYDFLVDYVRVWDPEGVEVEPGPEEPPVAESAWRDFSGNALIPYTLQGGIQVPLSF